MTSPDLAIKFETYGGVEVLQTGQLCCPAPGPGEIRLRHLAIGVNFIDIYHRKGVFAAPLPLPSGLGVEGVGIVTGVGPGVSGFAEGDRVGYVGGPPGGYATERLLPAARALHLPANLDDRSAAALLMKGLTVDYLIHRCAPVTNGDTVLLHAAAGGIGSIAAQWMAAQGVTVIGTVGSPDKIRRAEESGCAHVILSGDDFSAAVAEITKGRGVGVAFDSVGADTFARSLDCLRARGTMVSFGEASGPVPPFAIGQLGAKGSLFLTRPSIAHYTARRDDYEAGAARLFDAIATRKIAAPQITEYPLAEAARAHADLEARRTTGSVILLP